MVITIDNIMFYKSKDINSRLTQPTEKFKLSKISDIASFNKIIFSMKFKQGEIRHFRTESERLKYQWIEDI